MDVDIRECVALDVDTDTAEGGLRYPLYLSGELYDAYRNPFVALGYGSDLAKQHGFGLYLTPPFLSEMPEDR